MPTPKVLVSGGTGYTAVYTIIEYLNQGFEVNTTLRDATKIDATKIMIQKTGDLSDEKMAKLQFFEADMSKSEGWADSIEGCDYVCHVAYPFINGVPLEELIEPAMEGSMRLLKLAKDSPSVKHFVFCSSFATVGFDKDYPEETIVDDSFWTSLDSPMLDGYMKSKILVEKAMWEYVRSDENKISKYPITMTSICPYVICGPIPHGYEKYAGISQILYYLFTGNMDKNFSAYVNVTDVRDLAKGHVNATINTQAYSERFIFHSDDEYYFPDVVEEMRKKLPESVSSKIPTEIGELFIGSKKTTNAKAKKLLGYQPHPPMKSFMLTAEGIIRNSGLDK